MIKQNYFPTLFLILTMPFCSSSQINQIGLNLNVYGEVSITNNEYYEKPQNILDSILVHYEDKLQVWDFGMLANRHLQLLELEDPNWTNRSLIQNNDPTPSNSLNFFTPNREQFIIDTTQLIYQGESYVINENVVTPKYEDELIIHGNRNDSLITYLRKRLDMFIDKNKGKSQIEDDEWEAMNDEFSSDDTLVDKLVFYDYDGDKLSNVTGYYFNFSALERDTIRYDKKGRIIYFHRESVGSGGDIFTFTYNEDDQLIEMFSKYYDYHSDQYDPCPSCKIITDYEHKEYTYNELGLLYSVESYYESGSSKVFLKINEIP